MIKFSGTVKRPWYPQKFTSLEVYYLAIRHTDVLSIIALLMIDNELMSCWHAVKPNVIGFCDTKVNSVGMAGYMQQLIIDQQWSPM